MWLDSCWLEGETIISNWSRSISSPAADQSECFIFNRKFSVCDSPWSWIFNKNFHCILASMIKSLLAISALALTFLVLECFIKSAWSLEVTHVAFACEEFLILLYHNFSMIQNWSMLVLFHARKQMQEISKSSSFAGGALAENSVLRVMINSHAQIWLTQQGLPYKKAVPCREAFLPSWEGGRYQVSH